MKTNTESTSALAACVWAVAAVGCGGGYMLDDFDDFLDDTPPVDLTDPATVAMTAQYSHPSQVALFPSLLYNYFDSLGRTGRGCPRVIDNSDPAVGVVDRVLVADGCTIEDDAGDITLHGQIVVEGDATGTRVDYQDLRWESTEVCSDSSGGSAPVQGQAVIAMSGVASYPFLLTPEVEPAAEAFVPGTYDMRFKLDIRELSKGCAPLSWSRAYDYEFTAGVDGTRTTFDAAGRAAYALHEGPRPRGVPLGSWRVTIDGFVFEDDSACHEPMAGEMSLEAGGDTATIYADGATSCTSDECAPWRLNGELQPGEICNIVPLRPGHGCSASGPSAGWAALSMLVALAWIAWIARRRRRTTPSRQAVVGRR